MYFILINYNIIMQKNYYNFKKYFAPNLEFSIQKEWANKVFITLFMSLCYVKYLFERFYDFCSIRWGGNYGGTISTRSFIIFLDEIAHKFFDIFTFD